MIITLTGPNAYVLKQNLRNFINKFVATHTDIALEKFDGEELDPNRLPSILQALPFLATRRMVVLNQPSAQKSLVERLEKLLPSVSDSTDLIIVEPHIDKRTTYFKSLQKQTDMKIFSELSESDLAAWATNFAKQAGANLSKPDANYLISRLGTDQTRLANEIDKLVTFDPNISRAHIDQLTEPLPQSSVFDLLDTALNGQRQPALTIYQDLRRQNVDPQAILAMLAWQLHVLAVIKTAGSRSPTEIAAAAKISPFVIRKSLAITKRVSIKKLTDWVGDAYQLDIMLKSQPIDADQALQEYLTSLTT